MEKVTMQGQTNIAPAGKLSFLRVEAHQLQTLLDALDLATARAVKVLVKGLNSESEEMRVKCADKLIQYKLNIVKEINADDMQRAIAQVKMANGKFTLKDIDDDEDGSGVARLDFNTVQPT